MERIDGTYLQDDEWNIFFDRIKEKYGDSWRNKDYKFLNEVYDVTQFNGDLLDIGCSFGDGILYLKQKCKNITKFYGSDISSNAISVCESNKKLKDVDFFTFDISKELPRKFDNIICLQTLEHVDNPRLVMNNLIKATKKSLIVGAPYKNNRPDKTHIWSFDETDFLDITDSYILGQKREKNFLNIYILVYQRGWTHERPPPNLYWLLAKDRLANEPVVPFFGPVESFSRAFDFDFGAGLHIRDLHLDTEDASIHPFQFGTGFIIQCEMVGINTSLLTLKLADRKLTGVGQRSRNFFSSFSSIRNFHDFSRISLRSNHHRAHRATKLIVNLTLGNIGFQFGIFAGQRSDLTCIAAIGISTAIKLLFQNGALRRLDLEISFFLHIGVFFGFQIVGVLVVGTEFGIADVSQGHLVLGQNTQDFMAGRVIVFQTTPGPGITIVLSAVVFALELTGVSGRGDEGQSDDGDNYIIHITLHDCLLFFPNCRPTSP